MTTRVVAVRLDSGIWLRIYDHGECVAVPLEARRALLLGVDLIGLAAASELTLEATKRPLWGEARWGPGAKLG